MHIGSPRRRHKAPFLFGDNFYGETVTNFKLSIHRRRTCALVVAGESISESSAALSGDDGILYYYSVYAQLTLLTAYHVLNSKMNFFFLNGDRRCIYLILETMQLQADSIRGDTVNRSRWVVYGRLMANQ